MTYKDSRMILTMAWGYFLGYWQATTLRDACVNALGWSLCLTLVCLVWNLIFERKRKVTP